MGDAIDIGIARRARSLTEDLESARARISELEAVLAKDSIGRLSAERNLTPHSYKCGVHLRVLVDEEVPHVVCSVCKTVLDPVSVLLEYARRERNFAFSIQSLVDEQKKLHSDVEKLKGQRARLRTQIRKLGSTPEDERFVALPQFVVIATPSNVKVFPDDTAAFADAQQKAERGGSRVYVARLLAAVKPPKKERAK